MIHLNKRKLTILLLLLFFGLLVGVVVAIVNILVNQNINPGKTNAQSTQCKVVWTNPGCWKIVGVNSDTLCQNELESRTYNGQPDPYRAIYYTCSQNQGTVSNPMCGDGAGLIAGPVSIEKIELGKEYCASTYLGTTTDSIKCAQVDFNFTPANASSAGGAAICEGTAPTPSASCGDGVCSTGEECDWVNGNNIQSNTMNCGAGGGNTGPETNNGYWKLGGQNVCNSSCKIVTQTTPVNGSCGSANGTTNGTCGTALNANLCSAGTANPGSVILPGTGGSISWKCDGTNNGSSADCSASCTVAQTCQDVSFYNDTAKAAITSSGISLQCGQAVDFSFDPGTVTDISKVSLSDNTKGTISAANATNGGTFRFVAAPNATGSITVSAPNTQGTLNCGVKTTTINISCTPSSDPVKTWNMKVNLSCPDGTSLTSGNKVYYAFWPTSSTNAALGMQFLSANIVNGSANFDFSSGTYALGNGYLFVGKSGLTDDNPSSGVNSYATYNSVGSSSIFELRNTSGVVSNTLLKFPYATAVDNQYVANFVGSSEMCVQPKYPDLIIKKTADKQSVNPGAVVTYTLKVANMGEGATTGAIITVSDALPMGMTVNSASGTGWNCSNTASTVTCTTNEVLAKGQYTAHDITVVATVNSTTAAGSYVNNASVSGGGEPSDKNTDPAETGNDANNNDNKDKWTLTVTLAAVNGVCGSANNTVGKCGESPSGSLCVSGNANPSTVTLPNAAGKANWNCSGINGGTSVSCSASCNLSSSTKSKSNLPATSVQNGNSTLILFVIFTSSLLVLIVSRKYTSRKSISFEDKLEERI